jgi:hypothetical protein
MSIYNNRISADKITATLENLNNEYTAGKITRKQYLSRFSKAKNLNSFANLVKRYGAKVTKTALGYKFKGLNITAVIYLDGCETDYWTLDQFDPETSPEVVEFCEDLYETNQFETKSDAVAHLVRMDMEAGKK